MPAMGGAIGDCVFRADDTGSPMSLTSKVLFFVQSSRMVDSGGKQRLEYHAAILFTTGPGMMVDRERSHTIVST